MQQSTGTTDHPGLTIRIRTMNKDGQETSRSPVRKLRPAEHPMMTAVWPPCRCPLHGGSR